MKKGNRLAFEAESRRVARIEEAIQGACPGQDIDFEKARKRELERIGIAEPSALFLAREKQRNAGV